jgi:hypothetical protein
LPVGIHCILTSTNVCARGRDQHLFSNGETSSYG